MKKIIIGLILAVIIVGALVWYAPTIISYFQNSSSNSSDASYTKLTLREGINDTTTIEFGDTDYTLRYFSSHLSGSYLTVLTCIAEGTTHNSVNIGDTFKDFGIEIRVSNITSDYKSNYIVMLVKPTVQNYMASLMYTKVNMTLGEATTVSISSSLISKTNKYYFTYTGNYNEFAYFTISNGTQLRSYFGAANTATATDFDIETRIYIVEPQYMIIYVKPLY